MRTIATISQKGRAGKTTLSVHLATVAALSGHRAAIIDLDPQRIAASWGVRRRADAREVASGQATRIGVLIEAAQGDGADLLILDTAPNDDQIAL
jgi:chromosome partitioning protein